MARREEESSEPNFALACQALAKLSKRSQGVSQGPVCPVTGTSRGQGLQSSCLQRMCWCEGLQALRNCARHCNSWKSYGTFARPQTEARNIHSLNLELTNESTLHNTSSMNAVYASYTYDFVHTPKVCAVKGQSYSNRSHAWRHEKERKNISKATKALTKQQPWMKKLEEKLDI